jgi:hypothetical protein
MIMGRMVYVFFTILAALAPIVSYLSWRSGLGQPYSTLIGILILFIAIIILIAAGRTGPKP